MAESDDEIQLVLADGVAIIVLNRPKALNSLNTHMVGRMSQLLEQWGKASSQQPIPYAVVVKGAGGKAFCAGGDVKWVVEQMQLGCLDGPSRFFTIEYRLNHQISVAPLPYIALMDGVVMGGGAGVSVHGHFRVVTERTVFAMPECGIGLFPDIGSSFFLSKLPGGLGLWLGLTGTRLEGVDVRAAGLATHFVPSKLLQEVESRLQRLGAVHAAQLQPGSWRPLDLSEVNGALCQLEAEAGPLPANQLQHKLPWINHHFSTYNVTHILHSLTERQKQLAADVQQQGGPDAVWVDETLRALAKGSPLSQRITCELFARARHLTLQECLQLDLKLVNRFVLGKGDFSEGVRATLIDRGRKPMWKYASVQEVPDHIVQSFFEDMSNL